MHQSMNIGHSMKDTVGSDAMSSNSTTSIPSLKRTLSNGSTNTSSSSVSMVHSSRPQLLQQSQQHQQSHNHPHLSHLAPPNLTGHLGVGLNPTEHHSSNNIYSSNSNGNNTGNTSNPVGPPSMMRAVTSSAVYNRQPSSNTSSNSSNTNSQRAAMSGVQPTTITRTVTAASMQDWRTFLTIEERQAVRGKIRDAYNNRCTTYEDLLQVACALEEELLHISAPSRLDYFKSGFEYENRVKLKKDQLQGQIASNMDAKRRNESSSNDVSNIPITTASSPPDTKKQRR